MKLKIAYIHDTVKIGTGANYINDLIVLKLKERGVNVKSFYPRTPLLEGPNHLKGLANILFFYSLLEKKDKILKCDLIQGTTYTALTFLPFKIPVIAHFGSTTKGFLDSTPQTFKLEETNDIYYELRKIGVLHELNIRNRRPLRDIAEIEKYTANKSNAVIATSKIVKNNLLSAGVSENKINVIHNAIEDYWFEEKPVFNPDPKIIFLGRLGSDIFTFKLKGFDRLIDIFRKFPTEKKEIITITPNKKLINWMKNNISNAGILTNITKNNLPGILRRNCGSILFIPSRYEGFSLSLIEGMSQGLIPVTYPVGVAPEIIQNGKNGFLIEDQNQAKDRINLLLENEKLRKEMSEAAIETSQMFKANQMIDQLIRLYKEI